MSAQNWEKKYGALIHVILKNEQTIKFTIFHGVATLLMAHAAIIA